MLKRFVSYYKPHMPLFILDISVAAVMSLMSIFFPYLTRNLLKDHIPQQNIRMIVIYLLALLGIYISTLFFNYIRIKWGHILGVRMETAMRQDLFRHIQKLSFTYFDNTKTGHIMSRISSDLGMISEVAHHAPEDLFISSVVLTGAYTFMFTFSWPLALISLIPLPFMIVWGMVYGRRMRASFRRVRREIAEINSTVENSVQGIREVKSFTNEPLEEERFSRTNNSFRYARENVFTVMGRFHSVVGFLRDMYYFVVVGGGVILLLHGKVQIYDLVSFIIYVGVILPPIDRLLNFNEQLQEGAAAFERFTEIMDLEPEIRDEPGAVDLESRSGSIVMDRVRFRYSRSPEWVLEDISLEIPFGRKVAIVGESGAGKSTLVSLIPRFYEAQEGTISIGGHPIRSLTQKSLRDRIGIVQQNVFLFDATIRENIMYGNPEASEEDMVRATRMANLYGFIEGLPERFDTQVGERGVKLSGGQKQRVAIARVFLKNPPFWSWTRPPPPWTTSPRR
jgi:ATP-binding cassette subfamily B protein